MAESTGKNTAKWLLKADMANHCQDLQEQILSEMGFTPMEVVDKLYPNATPTERREKSQKISNNKGKRKK